MSDPLRLLVRVGVAIGLASAVLGGHVAAQGQVTTPIVSLDRYEVAPGDRVIVTVGGFDTNAVTISVCGNQARRGSTDCNMTASEGLRIDRGSLTGMVQMPIAAPPTPCPCVIRVSTRNNEQIAVAPITLVGHPVAPVVGGQSPVEPVAVSVIAQTAEAGFMEQLGTSLGAATIYDVTVTVRNRSTEPIEDVRIVGSVGRNEDDVITSLSIPDPRRIGPGQTWEETIQAELPAPVWGDFVWTVDVASDGPTVTASDDTRHVPFLLIVLVGILVLDVLILLGRLVYRLIKREGDDEGPEEPGPFDDMVVDDVTTGADDRVLVG